MKERQIKLPPSRKRPLAAALNLWVGLRGVMGTPPNFIFHFSLDKKNIVKSGRTPRPS
jgi:hypothetical protein